MTTIYPPARPSGTGSNRLLDIPALEDDGSNFQVWKVRITTVLELRGLMQYVDGSNSLTPLDLNDALAVQKDQRHEKEARAQIILTLKDEPLNGVLYCATAKEVWEKLHTHTLRRQR